MRAARLAGASLGLVLLVAGAVIGDDAKERPPAPEGGAQAVHGGTLVRTDAYALEVAIDGEHVRVWVMDREGRPAVGMDGAGGKADVAVVRRNPSAPWRGNAVGTSVTFRLRSADRSAGRLRDVLEADHALGDARELVRLDLALTGLPGQPGTATARVELMGPCPAVRFACPEGHERLLDPGRCKKCGKELERQVDGEAAPLEDEGPAARRARRGGRAGR